VLEWAAVGLTDFGSPLERASWVLAVGGEDASRVELDAFDGQGAVAEGHDGVPSAVRAETSSSPGRPSSATMSEW
jgi:hypothetical protein